MKTKPPKKQKRKAGIDPTGETQALEAEGLKSLRRASCLWCKCSMKGRRRQARFCSDLCRAMHHKGRK
jgi:hypothetical protein